MAWKITIYDSKATLNWLFSICRTEVRKMSRAGQRAEIAISVSRNLSHPLQRTKCKSQLLGNNDWAIVCFAGYEGRRSPFPSGHAVTLATTEFISLKFATLRCFTIGFLWPPGKLYYRVKHETLQLLLIVCVD